MDQERIYILTDYGIAGPVRWITCEYRDSEDHSCHGVLIYKQIFHMVGKSTVTYRTETSADFPINELHERAMTRVMFDHDDIWRDCHESAFEPKALKFRLEK